MIYPGNYFINNVQVIAAAQHLPRWPSDSCFLAAYDSVYADLSWVSVKTIIYNNSRRIAQIVIDGKRRLLSRFIIGNYSYHYVYYDHYTVKHQLYFAGFDVGYIVPLCYCRNITLKVFKLGNYNRLHFHESLEIVKYLVDNNLISKKDIEDCFMNCVRYGYYNVYKYLNKFVKNPISNRVWVKLNRRSRRKYPFVCKYIFDEIYRNPDISFNEILAFIKNFKN